MRSVPLALLAVASVGVGPLAAQREDATTVAGVVGFGSDPITAALTLEASYRIGPVLALSATAGHWFLNERCDSAFEGPCTPSGAWVADAGLTVAFADPARGWRPFLALRTGPVRFNYKPTTVWMVDAGLGLSQTGRSVGLQLEVRYHSLFGGTAPPAEANADRLMLYAGLIVTP
jgi:hypothetical protein